MEVARLDDDGLLIAIEPVAPQDWVTDLGRRQVALPRLNDAKSMVGRYVWDPIRQTFRVRT